ncbi:hypothetical protein Cgig2_027287 [Carnegiea gigantea]|uniref:Uncharacterized protein n=1 Tax=Carnegiea gigantea TaxID=171969 RepID=A0A9Q1K2Y7_9CARY|nr:hypothetical protein Cgig2_027287 [Carnegiea gigantea]
MPSPGHDDVSDSDDEVLVKRMKNIKQASKSRLKQIQLRSKKCARAQADKERKAIQKSPKTPIKCGQLSVLQHQQQHKSPNSTQVLPSVFKTPKWPPLGFIAMIEKFSKAQRQAIIDMGFGGFLYLQVNELSGDLHKWLVYSFDPHSVTLCISPDKKIEITPMDMHLTLALPIGGRKVEEFYKKAQRMPNTMKPS